MPETTYGASTMWRFLAGAMAALMLTGAGLFFWNARADHASPIPAAPVEAAADTPMSIADLAPPPEASEKTREQKRFSRYDKDRNGAVGRDEYLAARHKNFAKLDLNGDGKLSFDEYAAKAVTKFAAADRDRNGALNAAEFAATRVVRKARPRAKCAPSLMRPQAAEQDEG